MVTTTTTPQVAEKMPEVAQTTALVPQGWGQHGAEITTFNEAWRLAQTFAVSRNWKDVQSAAQAMVKMQAGAELGFSPFASMTNVFIIEGKPGYGASMVLARIINMGGRYKPIKNTVTECEIEWSRTWPGDDKPTVLGITRFTIADAERAELSTRKNRDGSKNTWQKYPEDLCWARTVTRGARRYFPDLFMGAVYDPEELRDEIDMERGGDGGFEPKTGEVGSTATAPAKTRRKTAAQVQDKLAAAATMGATVNLNAPPTTAPQVPSADIVDAELSAPQPPREEHVDERAGDDGDDDDDPGTVEANDSREQKAALAPVVPGDEVRSAPEKAAAPVPTPTPTPTPTPSGDVPDPPAAGASLVQALACQPADATGITKHFSKWNAAIPVDEQELLKLASRRAMNLASGKPEWKGIDEAAQAPIKAALEAAGKPAK